MTNVSLYAHMHNCRAIMLQLHMLIVNVVAIGSNPVQAS